MGKNCCVCKKRWRSGDSTIFHRFPKNSKVRQRWLNILGFTEQNLNNREICSDHFTPEDYTTAVVSGKPRLRKDVEPSLGLDRINTNHEQLHGMEMKFQADNKPQNSCYIDTIPEQIIEKSSILQSSHIDQSVHNDDYSNCDEILKKSKQSPNPEICIHSTMKCSSKRKFSPDCSDPWDNFCDDEFLNYKKIEDVKWEKVVNDPKKATMCWEIALETIEAQKIETKQLLSQLQSLESEVRNLEAQKPKGVDFWLSSKAHKSTPKKCKN